MKFCNQDISKKNTCSKARRFKLGQLVEDNGNMTSENKTKSYHIFPAIARPLAGYGLPPPRGNFVDHIFLEAQCLARILQHVSPLTMAALSSNSLLHTLPYKIFDN